MTTEALYYQTKLKLNRLGTGVGINLEPAVWVTLYNAAQTDWWKKALQTRSDSVLRDQLAALLVTDEPVIPYQHDERTYRFKTAANQYQLTGVYVNAVKEGCSRSFTAEPTSPQWVAENWHNPLSQPSFGWEETLYVNAQQDLLIYYTDFSITSALLSYYQSPPDIDLPGYVKLDGEPSRLINSDLPTELQQEILAELYTLLQ